MDKVRRLEMVIRAADLGSFGAAAKHMNITPSAVSRGIAELERMLRISIFKRSTRHIQLTEEGRQLYHRALDVLGRLAAIEVPANAVDRPAGSAPRFYYIQYRSPFRRQPATLPDIIATLVSRLKGRSFIIRTPADFERAIAKIAPPESGSRALPQ